MADQIIGYRYFADGVTRPVYLDKQGQYIIDEGEKVYGRFLDIQQSDEKRRHET